MPLDKASLEQALVAAFEQGMSDPAWTLAQSAAALAGAIDGYVRSAEVIGVTVDVIDLASTPIGTGTQSGVGGLQ